MLPSIGPVRDLNPAPLAATSRAADSPPDSKAHPLLLAAVGSGKQGSLAVLRRGLVPHLITSVPLQGGWHTSSAIALRTKWPLPSYCHGSCFIAGSSCKGVHAWAQLLERKVRMHGRGCAGVRGVWGVRYWPQGLDWEPGFAQHAYLLIAQDNGTRILQVRPRPWPVPFAISNMQK